MSKEIDKFHVRNIVRNLNNVSELPSEILERIPQQELDEINSEIARFNKFAYGIESKIITAKTWHKLKKTVDASA